MSRMSPSERFLPSGLVKAVVWVISSNVNSASHQRRRFIITHPESCLFVWNFRLDFFLRRRLSCIRYVPTYLRLSHAVGNTYGIVWSTALMNLTACWKLFSAALHSVIDIYSVIVRISIPYAHPSSVHSNKVMGNKNVQTDVVLFQFQWSWLYLDYVGLRTNIIFLFLSFPRGI